MMTPQRYALFCAALLGPAAASAEPAGPGARPAEAGPSEPEELEVVETKTRARPMPTERASSRVERDEIEVRQPRSAPDALRYEPGVFVQQTAHSQGSAYIRGRTGQQTVLLFDGIRLNNSLFRRGPNQYFFTIDSRTVESITVVRGSASTRYGSDAIAGAINARPIGPNLAERARLIPQLQLRAASADKERGGRLSVEAGAGPIAVLAGIGARRVERLEGGGIVVSPLTGEPPEVPRFEEDGRTQLGTGFDELTADLRAVARLNPRARLTAAAYGYMQLEAPRTDQCPPPEAPRTECLTYEEQSRAIAYLAADADLGAWARRARGAISLQAQRERRRYDRPSARAINRDADDLSTWGALWRAETDRASWTDSLDAKLRYGAELYYDRVQSEAVLILVRRAQRRPRSRGQYVSGSTYTWGGVWAEAEAGLGAHWIARAGARASYIAARSPGDDASNTAPVDRSWAPLVGNAGLEWWPNAELGLFANVDQGVRAPNLDDLTSRQRTGPGFQLENPDLEPERALTYELGAALARRGLAIDAWAFVSTLNDAIARTTRDATACPDDAIRQVPECLTTRSRLQLVNLPGTSLLWGAEAAARAPIGQDLEISATLSWAWGEAPRPVRTALADSDRLGDRLPISRVPPLNGTAEALWRPDWARGAYAGAGLRWAARQDRLALSDEVDARIPIGGTPGFAVLDLRAGWRGDERTGVFFVLENLTDAAYRYHGSSVNGPGLGATLTAEYGWE